MIAEPISVAAERLTMVPPDDDRNVRVSAELKIVYQGKLQLGLAKLQLIGWYAADGETDDAFPLGISEAMLNHEDVAGADDITISDVGYFNLPPEAEAESLVVAPNIVLYPVKWFEIQTIDLTDEGETGKDMSAEQCPIVVESYALVVNECDEDHVRYSLRIALKNRGPATVPIAVVRFKIVDQNENEIGSEATRIENLSFLETQVVVLSPEINETSEDRSGARLTLEIGVCRRPIIRELQARAPELVEKDQSSEDEHDDDEDQDNENSDDGDENSAAGAEDDENAGDEKETRPGRFKFSHVRTFSVGRERLEELCGCLGVRNFAELEALNSRGFRDEGTEAQYKKIDEAILPHLELDVFFENFAEPGLIFPNAEGFGCAADAFVPPLLGCQITHFKCRTSSDDDGSLTVEIGVEADFRLDVSEDVDIEQPDSQDDTDIGEQLRECTNMFNFSIKNFDYSDDEVLEHEWSAQFEPPSEQSVEAASGPVAIEFDPLPPNLARLAVEIKEVVAEGPDDDGDLSVLVKYAVTNSTAAEIQSLDARAVILSAQGAVIESTNDETECALMPGETADFSISMSTKADFLGRHRSSAQILLRICASEGRLEQLGEIDVPVAPFKAVPMAAIEMKDVLRIVKGSVWTAAPDGDGDTRVHVMALVQNLTDNHLQPVQLIAEMRDRLSRDLGDAGDSIEIRPGELRAISGSAYSKAARLKSARMKLVLRTYWPVASGTARQTGLGIED